MFGFLRFEPVPYIKKGKKMGSNDFYFEIRVSTFRFVESFNKGPAFRNQGFLFLFLIRAFGTLCQKRRNETLLRSTGIMHYLVRRLWYP
jgi:hypothetical protein